MHLLQHLFLLINCSLHFHFNRVALETWLREPFFCSSLMSAQPRGCNKTKKKMYSFRIKSVKLHVVICVIQPSFVLYWEWAWTSALFCLYVNDKCFCWGIFVWQSDFIIFMLIFCLQQAFVKKKEHFSDFKPRSSGNSISFWKSLSLHEKRWEQRKDTSIKIRNKSFIKKVSRTAIDRSRA